MEVIIELASAFKKEGLRSQGVKASSKSNNLIEKYLGFILEGKANTDKELAKKIYGIDHPDHKYRNLKKRVKQVLLDLIPLMDWNYLKRRSEYQRKYDECFDAYVKLTKLAGLPVYDTILDIIHTVYKTALKYQFYDLLFYYSYHLIRVYALRGNIKALEMEVEMFETYKLDFLQIFNSKVVFLEANAILARKSLLNSSKAEYIIKRVDRLSKQFTKSYDARSLHLYVKTHNYVLQNDIESLLQHLDRYEQLLDSWEFANPGRLSLLAIQKLYVLFHLKNYEHGLLFASKYEGQITTKNNNWTLFKRYEFCLAINHDLNRTYEIYCELVDSEIYNLLNNKFVTQLWYIHKAYLNLLLTYHKDSRILPFNIFRFMNDVELYSKDKSGYNFSIIVIELLFHLVNKDMDRYIDRMTALMSYRIRHLKGKMFKRSSVFAQLLLSVDKYGFRYKKIYDSSRLQHEYLNSLEDRLSINEWEIVDYATLWDIVLELIRYRD